MNTRRTRRNAKIEVKSEENQEINNAAQSRKRQKVKVDSSDEEKPAETLSNKNIEQEISVKPRIERKRSKFDTDDEDDDVNDEQNTSNTSQGSRKRPIPKIESDEDGSSSDSSVGDYLKAPDEIDLDSSFFNFENENKPPDFDAIEKKMFSGIQRLSDSEESDEETNIIPEIKVDEPSNSQSIETVSNFTQLNNYNKKLEDAKACVENYKSKKSKQIKKAAKIEKNKVDDISQLLSVGETKNRDSIDSSQNDFESDDELDWEEIEEGIEKQEESVKIPKEGVQITVELPNAVRKKAKGVDLMAAIKRRINRVKKENQVYVHKVHLLCWVAHGNFLNNSVLNNEILLGQALSLLPSEQCYPPKHADIKYLEQISRWYGKMMKLQEIPPDNQISINDQLNQQISKKQATCKRNFILLFIIILRSLGLQCRLVLSFQCLPLRPPNSELCSLSTKESKTNDKSKEKSDVKASTSKESNTKSSKSKPVTVNTSFKNKLNKTLNDSIKNRLNQSLNNSKPSDTNKIKKSVRFGDNKTITDKKDTKSKSSNNKKSSNETKTDNPSLKSKDSKEKLDTSKSKSKKLSTIKETLEKNSNPSPKKEEIDGTAVPSTSKSSSKKLSIKEKLEKNSNPSPKKEEINGTAVPSTSKSSSKKLSIKEKLEKNSNPSPKKEEINGTAVPSTSKSKSSSKKLSLKEKLDKNIEKIPQLDGADDSDSSTSKSKAKSSKKASLSSKLNRNLSNSDDDFTSSNKNIRKARNKPVKYVDSESAAESDFQPSQGTSSPAKSPVKDINHNKKSKPSNDYKNRPSTSKSSTVDVRGDLINLIKSRLSEARQLETPKLVQKSSKNDSDYDSDFHPEPKVKKRRSGQNRKTSDELMGKIEVNTKVKRRVKPRSQIDRRATSSDEDDSQDPEKKKKIGNDIWVEVFLEEEEKWISVDLIKGQVHCISELHNRASHPISYIVAWNNNLSLKDITARYCPNWNTVTRKLRVDSVWWNQTLKPFIGVKTARDKEEDEDLARQQLDKPLPTTISEYKNHPLYALRRHLLKFEGIYPPDAVTLGFVRKEAVYARECVHTLHSREIWVKHAKVVKPGQEPYKIVKARPKYDKLTGNTITDLPLELFGPWQVEDYVPPTAENGVVPRNAFGNVELFKPCMLPKKTVHLQLPGLNKVAKKLRIDCAPAVVGFDFHCGGSHPTFDGFVVCEEFKDVLIAAWEEDRDETAKRELEKYEKRVYGNWRKLIKGLLIRERLKARYDFGNPSDSKKKVKPSKPKKAKPDLE